MTAFISMVAVAPGHATLVRSDSAAATYRFDSTETKSKRQFTWGPAQVMI